MDYTADTLQPFGEASLPKRKKEKGASKMAKDLAVSFIKRGALVFLGYIVGVMGWSCIIPLITIGSLVWLERQYNQKSKLIASKYAASQLKKEDLQKLVSELPSWVTFPDREKAEWLNEIIRQLWPSLCYYIENLCRTSIQKNIRKKFDSFRFSDIDFGAAPPKIDGVKCYNTAVTKGSIIIDFDVIYDGNCNINFSLSGTQIGRIKDFQLGVLIRVVLKPLLVKKPLIGGIQVFFLNTPDINFELEGITSIPGLAYFIRQKIEENINKKIVFPNKITKKLAKTVEAVELKALEPEGVLRVHVFEAKNLERKDVTGKSDPYVVLKVGGHENVSPVVKRSLNPLWDYWCEFVVIDKVAQQLLVMLFDEDEFNEDDPLGRIVVEINDVIKEGKNDRWFELEEAKHGQIHLRFTWLGLSEEMKDLEAAAQETKLLKVSHLSQALLTVYVDSAHNIPKAKDYKKPTPYFKISVGDIKYKSRTKKHTIDPEWEQGFSLLVPKPLEDILNIDIFDKDTGKQLDSFSYNIRNLTLLPNLQITKEEFDLPNGKLDSTIKLSMQLRILTNELFEDESESESDFDENTSLNHSLFSNNTEITDSSINSFAETEVVAEKKILTPNLTQQGNLGKIDITLFYCELRQKLSITIHKIENLFQKNPDDIPDPYVKLTLTAPEKSTIRNKTKVVDDNCNPVYEEVFEYSIPLADLAKYRLIMSVKTKKGFFNRNIIGQTVVNFKTLKNLDDPYRCTLNLNSPRESD